MPSDQEPSTALTRFAAAALLERLHNMTREIDGVLRNEDIEYVHRIRVASRRMRSALTHLKSCFAKEDISDWRKEVRRITKKLGDARDLDVQIEAVEQYRDALAEDASDAGVQRLLLRLRQRREQVQPRIEKALDRFLESGVVEDMERRLRPLADAEPEVHAEAARYPTGWRLARDAVVEQLDALHDHDPYLPEPDDSEELHAMRIALKRLRYTMELFNPIYDDQLKPFIKEAKAGQTLLGDLHDCDVWIEFLGEFLQDERRHTEASFGDTCDLSDIERGIGDFLADRRARRETFREDFLHLWEAQQAARVWEKLRDDIEGRAAPAPAIESNTPGAEQPAGGGH